MVIRHVQALEDMIAGLQRRAEEEGELPAVCLTSAAEDDSEAITVCLTEEGMADVSYARGNVVLHGESEALVLCPDGSQQLFTFDPSSGKFTGSLFVANDGEERLVDEAVSEQNRRAVEGAWVCFEEALAHLERFRIKPFEV